MNKIFTILFLSFVLAGELEVEGNLTVTGQIQSTTIDSLLQIIANLQAQIALLQQGANNKLETRIYTLNDLYLEYNHGSCNEPDHWSYDGGCNSIELDLDQITGETITNALVDIYKIEDVNNYGEAAGILYMHWGEYPQRNQVAVVECHNDQNIVYGWPFYQSGNIRGSETITYYSESGGIYLTYVGSNGTIDLTLAITTQFSN